MSAEEVAAMSSYTTLKKVVQHSNDPIAVMQRVVDEALKLVRGADGAVVELLGPDGATLTYVCCAGTLWHSLGMRVRAESVLSGLALRDRSALICLDSEVDPRVDSETCRKVGTISMVCVPLIRDDVLLGVLKVSSVAAGAFSESDVRLLNGLAEFMAISILSAHEMKRVTSDLLSASIGDTASHYPRGQVAAFISNVINPVLNHNLEKRRRIEAILGAQSVSFMFQPIIDLDARKLCAAEALARFKAEPNQAPHRWFSDAHLVGLGVEMELAAAQIALNHVSRLPAGACLALNVGPEAMMSDEIMVMLASVDPEKVVIELTEHAQVDDYPSLVERFAEIRGLGVRLAIDDTGSGFSSFSHVIKLSPDIMKLDRELIRNIDKDPVRLSLTNAVVKFADDTGTELIAEGIETPEELSTIVELGVKFAQGYLLGRPAPVGSLGTWNFEGVCP